MLQDPGDFTEQSIQMDAPELDLGLGGQEDPALQQIFASDEVRDALEAQALTGGTATIAAPTVSARTASTRTVGTRPSAGVRQLGGSGLLHAGVAERYIEAQLQVLASLEKKVESLTEAAEESAARLVAGGNLYLAGEPGMVSELLSRAGGPCGAKALPLDKPLPAMTRNDVVLLSDYGTPGKLAAALEKLAAAESLVIVFASAENPLLRRPPSSGNRRFVPVDIPWERALGCAPVGATYGLNTNAVRVRKSGEKGNVSRASTSQFTDVQRP